MPHVVGRGVAATAAVPAVVDVVVGAMVVEVVEVGLAVVVGVVELGVGVPAVRTRWISVSVAGVSDPGSVSSSGALNTFPSGPALMASAKSSDAVRRTAPAPPLGNSCWEMAMAVPMRSAAGEPGHRLGRGG